MDSILEFYQAFEAFIPPIKPYWQYYSNKVKQNYINIKQQWGHLLFPQGKSCKGRDSWAFYPPPEGAGERPEATAHPPGRHLAWDQAEQQSWAKESLCCASTWALALSQWTLWVHGFMPFFYCMNSLPVPGGWGGDSVTVGVGVTSFKILVPFV